MAKISNKAKHRVSQAILLTVIFLLIVMLIYPLMMALWNSFKSDIEYERSKWYPTFPLRYKNLISGFNATYWECCSFRRWLRLPLRRSDSPER